MISAYTIVGQLDRELDDNELSELVQDLYSFKKYARVNGKIMGMENRMINVYDETYKNSVNNRYGGLVRVYIETDEFDVPVEDMVDIFRRHEATVTHFSKKWRVRP